MLLQISKKYAKIANMSETIIHVFQFLDHFDHYCYSLSYMQVSYLVAVGEEEDRPDHSEVVAEEEDHLRIRHSEAVEVEEVVLVDFLKGV